MTPRPHSMRAIAVPARFFRIRYNGRCYPGGPGVHGVAGGANCQHFAYELLRYFSLEPKNFRSSELWMDSRYSRRVIRRRPLDLLLFNRTPHARGAHIAVYLGDGCAVHLSRQVGRPIIWKLGEFVHYPQYRFYIGAKRILPGSVSGRVTYRSRDIARCAMPASSKTSP